MNGSHLIQHSGQKVTVPVVATVPVATDIPQWFVPVDCKTRADRIKLLHVLNLREADHEAFKGTGQKIVNLIRQPYLFQDRETKEEREIPRFLCLNTDGKWLNVFAPGMVQAIDNMVRMIGLPPYDPPLTFVLTEKDVGKPSPFLGLVINDE